FNTTSLNRSRALAPGSPRLSATVAWIACASATSLAFARASALATLAASACARSVSVLFGVPRCLPPRLAPGFEPPPGMVSGYFCRQWLLLLSVATCRHIVATLADREPAAAPFSWSIPHQARRRPHPARLRALRRSLQCSCSRVRAQPL